MKVTFTPVTNDFISFSSADLRAKCKTLVLATQGPFESQFDALRGVTAPHHL